jgi:ribosomal protein S18 acetylase RimI-like enzyme
MLFGNPAKSAPAICVAPPIVSIRYASSRDNERIADINDRCGEPDRADVLARSLADPYGMTRVAERGNAVLGFLQYGIHPDHVELTSFAVHPDARRTGVGRAMAVDAKHALKRANRPLLTFVVSEADMPALRFWRSCGVRATGILWGRFGRGTDGIQFEWSSADAADGELASQNCPEAMS